jgi:hypothetical protein
VLAERAASRGAALDVQERAHENEFEASAESDATSVPVGKRRFSVWSSVVFVGGVAAGLAAAWLLFPGEVEVAREPVLPELDSSASTESPIRDQARVQDAPLADGQEPTVLPSETDLAVESAPIDEAVAAALEEPSVPQTPLVRDSSYGEILSGAATPDATTGETAASSTRAEPSVEREAVEGDSLAVASVATEGAPSPAVDVPEETVAEQVEASSTPEAPRRPEVDTISSPEFEVSSVAEGVETPLSDAGSSSAVDAVESEIAAGQMPEDSGQSNVGPSSTETVPGAVVFINAPSSVPADELESVVENITQAGYAIERAVRVGFRISETNVRYYHDEDAEFANAIADLVSGRSRDFTTYRPSPDPGTIEVWLGS